MATQDLTIGGAGDGRPMPEGRVFTMRRTVNTLLNNYAASDVLQLFNVQAGWFVDMVAVEVHTAEGAAATGDIGDGDDPNGYIDAVNLNSATPQVMTVNLTEGTPNTIADYSNGKVYTADDTIDLTLDHALDAAIFTVIIRVTDLTVDNPVDPT